MRALFYVFTVMVVSVLWVSLQETPEMELLKRNRMVFTVTPDTVFAAQPIGGFEPEIVEMFHVIFPPEPGRVYTEPDKDNTRIFYLYQFPSPSDQTILIETSAGAPGGSCGNMIKAGTYYPGELRWESMVEECGGVDTVYSLRHNYMCDFSVTDKWGKNKMRYQYNGEMYIGVKDPQPISDTDLIAVLIHRELKDFDYVCVRDYIMPEMEWNHVNLDSSNNPYLFLHYGMDGVFIVHEDAPHEFSLINFLKRDVEVNIQRTHHNGMPDIRTFNTSYVYNNYRWNGKKYALHDTDEWVCPY